MHAFVVVCSSRTHTWTWRSHPHLPTLRCACLRACRSGEALNINADVAARELAIALKPLRVVFISAGGGWKEGPSIGGQACANLRPCFGLRSLLWSGVELW